MTAEEIARAQRAIAELRLPDDEVLTRRMVAARAQPAGRSAPLVPPLAAGRRSRHRSRLPRSTRVRHPPIVALCDISGSMADYTRLFLHFLHALTDARRRVHTFLFGTRLTNVTRSLKSRDPDEALTRCSAQVQDWSGGTRIATCLHQFNREWSRRVLGQGAVVLLFTDGLERDGTRRSGARDGPAAPLLPAARVAEPAAALRRVRGARRRASAPCCRMSTSSGRSITSPRWRPWSRRSAADDTGEADPRRWLKRVG